MATLLLASFASSGVSDGPPPPLKVKVTPPSVGPLPPSTPTVPSNFWVNVEIENVMSLHAFEIKISWNQKILSIAEGDVEEGPFLSQGGLLDTYFANATGVAFESVTVAGLITTYDVSDGSGLLFKARLMVIGGGETDIVLEDIRLEDADGNPIYEDVIVNGYFWSEYPYIDFKAFVAVSDDGKPENMYWLFGGTMFYGDMIKFDASGSYDLDGSGSLVPLDPSNFKWVIRAGGVDTYVRRGVPYDFRYETGAAPPNELGPNSDVVCYAFPGALPSTYALYGASHLGWHDLKVSVTDSDGHTSEYYTWIRIFRLSPARTVMETKTTSNYHLSQHGVTYGNKMYFAGKVQDRGGTGWFPYEVLSVYLELARMIHGFMWARMSFTIRKLVGGKLVTVKTLVSSDTQWLGPEETSGLLGGAVWEGIGLGDVGFYTSSAKGYICGQGATYGLAATGTIVKSFVIKP